MYHVSTQGVDERMINVHYYYYYNPVAPSPPPISWPLQHRRPGGKYTLPDLLADS